jgi:hypothetical protein
VAVHSLSSILEDSSESDISVASWIKNEEDYNEGSQDERGR